MKRANTVGRGARLERLLYAGLLTPAIILTAGGSQASAGQLAASAFQPYNSATAASIQPGPFSLFTVPVDSLLPTQLNEGFTEVGKKTAGFDLLAPSQLQSNLLTDIEPVVIGPGGALYLTDGHHTFTALDDSLYGAEDASVYVNVIANYSNLTESQFLATMQSQNLLFPVNDGVYEPVNGATGAPLPSSLTGLTSDVYRGLEYSILKNKSSVLFATANNITGAVGASTPGLDKMTGYYSDFIEADAYRGANGGRGLPYLSPGDVALATQWNLNPNSATSLPSVAGTVTAAQLPGFILGQNIDLTNVVGNATLAGGALDGNGGFTGITSINAGTASSPVTVGTPNVGFVMQLGNDAGYTVTLGAANTYTGGTSILAGDLIVASDASLGAAAPAGAKVDPNAVLSSVQADNGVVFNSLTEGNGTLTIGTTPGGGTSAFNFDRPIAVGGEAATLDLNGYVVTLTGEIASLGTDGVGLGNATGESDLTIDDNSSNQGLLILSGNNPYFYGNLVIGNNNAPTVRVMDDAALGNASGPADTIGEIELNGGTLQAGASFSAPERNLFLGGGSQFDVNGFSTSWGVLTDVQRTLEVENSNTTTAGAVTFNAFDVASTATLQLAGGPAGETVAFTNGIARTGNATVVLQPSTSTSLGAGEKVLSGPGAASLVNAADPIAPAWIVTNNGASKGDGPYDFVTYGANGYVKATYNATSLSNASGQVVALAANAAPTGNVSAFALNTEGKTITLGAGATLTVGDGTDPAGLILASGSKISSGTLAFGGSEGVIWMSGSNPSVSATITGSNGLTFAGSGGVSLSAAENVSGPITIDSGAVTLAGTGVFASNAAGITLSDVKSHPAPATLDVSANNTLAALSSGGNNSAVNLSNGAALTLGDTVNNESSTLSSTIAETGLAVAGALTFNGSGLFDLSGGSKNALNLEAGSTIVVDNSAQLRVVANEFKNNFGVTLNGSSQLQFAQNGGGVFANPVSGTGSLRLIGGTLQITGANNTYSGGTYVETGSTLDVTTANLPADNPNIVDAGGLVVFDQATTGTYSGVISDGPEMGTGPVLSGSLDKDDSTGANAGDVILTNPQTFTGATTIEAGALTLDAVNALATSSGVDLGRVGGGATASLILGANNAIQALSSEADNTTSVQLGSNVLAINTPASVAADFGGDIEGAGALVKQGLGLEILSGVNTYAGGTTIASGTLQLGDGTNNGSLAGAIVDNATLSLDPVGSQTFGNAISGSGALAMVGTGTAVLSGANSYSGATLIAGGTLALSDAGSIAASSGVQDNGAFDISGAASGAAIATLSGAGGVNLGAQTLTLSAADGVFSGAIQGSGGLTLAGTETLSGASSYSGTTLVQSGELIVGNALALGTSQLVLDPGTTLGFAANGLTLANAIELPNADPTIDTGSGIETLSGGISGAGSLTKIGSGTLILAGTDSYSGATTVAAGALDVDGSVANSAFSVDSGATLGGPGTIGGLSVASGAAVAPGAQTPYSTLAVANAVSFAPGSTYLVNVDAAGASDAIAAGGAATLSGGTVLVNAATDASYAGSTAYAILTAAGGVSGAFSGATTNLAFLSPVLAYGADQVTLNLERNNVAFASAANTPNERAAAAGIQGLGAGNAVYDAVLGLTAAQAPAAYDSASGEIQASAQSAAIEDMRLPREAILDRLASGPYGTLERNAFAADGFVDSAASTAASAPARQGFTAWGRGFGDFGHIGGNGDAAALDRSLGGFVAGVDVDPDDHVRVGVATGYTQSNDSVDARSSSATIESAFGGVYGGFASGGLRLSGGLLASAESFMTDRNVAVGSLADVDRASYGGALVQGFGELGWRFALAKTVSVEPFVGGAAMQLHTDAFTESGGAAALTASGHDDDVQQTTLGARYDYAPFAGLPILAHGMIGWLHGFGDLDPTATLAFASAPGNTFAVTGAPLARNALVDETGLDWQVSAQATLGLYYSGELAGRVSDNALEAKFEMEF